MTRKDWPPVCRPPLRTGSIDCLRTGPRTTSSGFINPWETGPNKMAEGKKAQIELSCRSFSRHHSPPYVAEVRKWQCVMHSCPRVTSSLLNLVKLMKGNGRIRQRWQEWSILTTGNYHFHVTLFLCVIWRWSVKEVRGGGPWTGP